MNDNKDFSVVDEYSFDDLEKEMLNWDEDDVVLDLDTIDTNFDERYMTMREQHSYSLLKSVVAL